MIIIYKTPTCAYCKQVCQFLDWKKISYELREAVGDEYSKLLERFGMTVPLIYNTETDNGMVGYDISKILYIVGLA